MLVNMYKHKYTSKNNNDNYIKLRITCSTLVSENCIINDR